MDRPGGVKPVRYSPWLVVVAVLAALPVLAQDPPVTLDEEDLTSDVWHQIAYLTDAEDGPPAILSAGPGFPAPLAMSAGHRVAALGPDGQSPMAWHPDGSQLAFVSDSGAGSSIVVTSPTGDSRVLATGLPGRAYSPQWSPTGRFLTVVAPEAAGASLYLVATANGQVTRLSTGTVDRAVWADDVDVLAIVGRGGIEVWSPEQAQALHVPGTESVQGRVSWSHDAQLLALDGVLRDGTKGIIVVRPSQGTMAEVGVDEPGLRLIEMNPAREELLALRPLGGDRFHVVRFAPPWKEGENVTLSLGEGYVTPSSVTDDAPLASYSPTGQYVAFVAHPENSMLARYLYVMRDGGTPICVSEPVGVQSINWYRDGSRIAFTGRRGSVGRLSQSVYITAPTGGGYARLATNVLGYEWAPGADAVAYISPLSRSRRLALGAVSTATGEERWLSLGVLRAEWRPR
jgi:hypothetical protein